VSLLGASDQKPDIIWILIDGVRPDKLHSCGNTSRPSLFIDEVLERGTLFTCVIAAGTNSKTSMHSAFSALNPSIHRMNAYDPDLQINFDPRVVTITDILKANDYVTFRYVDAVQYEDYYDLQQVIPSSGFDVWESGGYALLRDTPHHSFATAQRTSFIDRFNRCEGPKFAYIHLLTSHEIYPERVVDCTWTSEIYEEGLSDVSDDFELLWNSLTFRENSLVVVATDHGVRLDCHLVNDLVDNGINLRDQSCRTFCSFIGSSLPAKKFNRMVRNIDIAPTLLDIAGICLMPGQGRSLLPLIHGEDIPPLLAFIEGVGSYEIPRGEPRVANIWGVRTDKWKYWIHKTRGDCLFDLESDPDEKHNLVGTGLAVEEELRQAIANEMHDHPRDVSQVYDEFALDSSGNSLLRREDIMPEVSIVLLAGNNDTFLDKVIRNIRGQLAVYWELVVVHMKGQTKFSDVGQLFDDFRIKQVMVDDLQSLGAVIEKLTGRFILFLRGDTLLNPDSLYRLRSRMSNGVELLYNNCSYAEVVDVREGSFLFPAVAPSQYSESLDRIAVVTNGSVIKLVFSINAGTITFQDKLIDTKNIIFAKENLATVYLAPGLLLRYWLILLITLKMWVGIARRVARRLRGVLC